MSSCSGKRICGELCDLTWATITGRERIWPWKRTHPRLARHSRRRKGGWSKFRKSAVSITGTRDARHSPGRPVPGSQHPHLTQHLCAIALSSTTSDNNLGKRHSQTTLSRTRRSVFARRVARRSLETGAHQDPPTAIGPSFGEGQAVGRSETGAGDGSGETGRLPGGYSGTPGILPE